MAQWLGIHLPMQEAWVPSLVREDPTSCWTTKPSHHNYWNLCALGPPSRMSPRAASTEGLASGACGLQQERPLQREARTPQLESNRRPPQLEESPHSSKDPAQPRERKNGNSPRLSSGASPPLRLCSFIQSVLSHALDHSHPW